MGSTQGQTGQRLTGLVEVWSARVGEGEARDRERICDFVRMHEAVTGRSVTGREVQRGLRLDHATVVRLLAALVEEGRLEFVAGGWVRDETPAPPAIAAVAAHDTGRS